MSTQMTTHKKKLPFLLGKKPKFALKMIQGTNTFNITNNTVCII